MILILLLWIHIKTQADIVLKQGQIHSLTVQSSSVLIGSKKIIEVKNGKIIAKKVGERTLSSSRNYEKVSVLTQADWQLWKLIKETKKFQGQCALKNGQIYLKSSLSLEKLGLLSRLLDKTQGQLFLESKVPQSERAFFEKQWRRKLSAYPASHIQFLWEPYLQLRIVENINKQELLEKLNGFAPPILIFKQKFEQQPLVETLVVMTEINRTEAHSMGLEWPTSATLDLVPKITGPESLLMNIHALESKGHGKVLAKPVLIAKSGAEALFLAGGEFPIRVISRHTKDVIWKQHGILLKVKPIVGLNQQINLQITSEISLLDKGNAVDGIPALKTNRVQSEVNVESGQTLALSGLLREDLGTDRSGLIGLASLPILGPLFRSENFLKSHSELVVFLIPRIKTESSRNESSLPALDNLEVPFDFE